MARTLIINISDQEKKGLVKSPRSAVGQNLAPIVKADSEPLQIFPVIPTGDRSRPWESVDWTGYSIAASIGNPGQKPTGGTFDLNYGANTASALAFDITPSALDTALNALASITSDGGVSVSGLAGDYYLIEWNNVGARATAFTHNSKTLTPFGSVITDTIQAGDASTKEIRIIRLRSQVYATKGVFTPVADITGIVTQISAGDGSSHAIQIFKFSRQPIGGTFTITFDGITTISLPFDASASDVQTALGASYLVEGPNGGPWTVEKNVDGAVALGSMDVDGISGLDGWEAILKTSTKELFIELASTQETSISRTFEVEVTDGSGNVETVLQIPVTISKEVMASGIITSLASEFGVPAGSGAVLYSLVQSLTDGEKEQAWNNLGINSYVDLAAANTGEALHNVLFYNTTLNKLQMTTSSS